MNERAAPVRVARRSPGTDAAHLLQIADLPVADANGASVAGLPDVNERLPRLDTAARGRHV